MRYAMVFACLTSFALARAAAQEKPDLTKDGLPRLIKNVRLIVEAPHAPIVLDPALPGKIPLRIFAENFSEQPITLCRPADGSFVVDRDPAYVFRLVDAKGQEVRRNTEPGCAWNNYLK